MATGFDWDALKHATYNTGTDFDGVAIADAGTQTTDVIDNDTKAATEIAIISVENGTGATDGDVIVSILGSDLDPDSEGYQNSGDNVFKIDIAQAQSATERRRIVVPADSYSKFKVHIENQCGQEVAVTVNYRQATIPAA